ncbi:MAG TPA: N-acetyltransferase [Blastocatellia bacterium]|nr:N-acetyltransferase [Blastocatellia bacterium]
MTTVRAEEEEDYPQVARVIELAFGQADEARLVAALRTSADPHISLVAVEDDRVVGHIFFSPVTIESDRSLFTAMGLAPLAVLPEYQNRGVGSLLVWEGLKECLMIGHRVVVVLGHPAYYPRFGFQTAKLKGITCEYDVPEDHFMVAELEPGALGGRQGLVKYHPEFNKF